MGVCTKRIDSYEGSCDRDCHFVESFMTPLYMRPKLHPAPPGPRPVRHELLHSASCRLVFPMCYVYFICMCPYLLHSFWLLGFGSVRVRGSVPSTPLRGDFRGWSTSLLLGTTRIQYTIYDLVNARKGRT